MNESCLQKDLKKLLFFMSSTLNKCNSPAQHNPEYSQLYTLNLLQSDAFDLLPLSQKVWGFSILSLLKGKMLSSLTFHITKYSVMVYLNAKAIAPVHIGHVHVIYVRCVYFAWGGTVSADPSESANLACNPWPGVFY